LLEVDGLTETWAHMRISRRGSEDADEGDVLEDMATVRRSASSRLAGGA
jgi:hypothetical protein